MVRCAFFVCRRFAPVLVLTALVAACGGGGGSDSGPAASNMRPSVGALSDRTLTVGDALSIEVTVTDADTADSHTVTAGSSDTEVVTVSVDGTTLTLTAVAAGTATITVTARDTSGAANAESQSVAFTVTVEERNARPSVGALSDRTLTVGDALSIEVTVTDADTADSHTVTAGSSDTEVVTVSVNGTTLTLTTVAAGTATITVTARDNSDAANAESEAATFSVTVEKSNARPSVAGIADQSIDAGESVDIEISVTDDDDGDTHTIMATASDDGVVEISLADAVLTVKGLAAGTATVTVTARDDSGSDSAESEPVTFEVTVEVGWVEGVFQPADLFKDYCANPRQPNPASGDTFPDMPGETVDENNWLRSWSNDTYLWYDEIVDRNPARYDDTLTYFDLLRTTARTPSGNLKDNFHFTYTTEEWEALVTSGASVGYGAQIVLLSRQPPREAVVAFTEPGSSADSAGLARGTRILRIDGVDLVYGSDVDTLNAGLFPSEDGEMHQFEVESLNDSEPRTVTLTAEVVISDPVQHLNVLETDSGPVGYMLFNDFIGPAERELIDAFDELSDAGITDLVLDLRYNRGGYLDIASQLGFMVAGPSAAQGRVFEELRFNDKHTAFDPVTRRPLRPLLFHTTSVGFSVFDERPLPSANLSRVFVLTGQGTCSASEAVMNGLRGIDIDVVQIGSTTCGKPYGFYATDNCGTTYFTVQFQGVNAKGFGDYSDGFSPANVGQAEGTEIPGCSVADDFEHGFADPEEGRLQAALRYRMDGMCPAPTGIAGARSDRGFERKSMAIGTLADQRRGLKVLTRER